MSQKSTEQDLEKVIVKVNDDVTLRGVLHGAEPARRAVLVCPSHPDQGGGAMDTSLVKALCRGLAEAGALALRFDYRGVGGSTGKPTGGKREHRDVLACMAWLQQRTGEEPHLVGYSFGATMALSAVDSYGKAASVCCVGLPTAPTHHHVYKRHPLQKACKKGLKLQFLSGDKDRWSDTAWIRRGFEGPNITVETLPRQGHSFEGKGARRLVDRVKSFLGLDQTMDRESKAQDGEQEVTVKLRDYHCFPLLARGRDTGVRLQGVLHGKEPTLCAVLVCPPHPFFGGSMDPSPVTALCEGLADAGALVLRFDYRGVGRSTGQHHGTQESDDVVSCLNWLGGRTGQLPHLVGCSYGAAMALDCYRSAASVCCVGLPTASPAHSVDPGEVLEEADNLGLRMLFLSGDEDQLSDAAWIRSTFDGPEITVEALPQKGHSFEGKGERRLLEWVKGFLGLPRYPGQFNEWIDKELAEQRARRSNEWVSRLAVKHNVRIIDGDNVTLFFVGAGGAVYSLDLDALGHRLELETGNYARGALRRASRRFPALCELLVEGKGP